MDEVNNALHSAMGSGHGGRNVETKYAGPDGVMIVSSGSGPGRALRYRLTDSGSLRL